MVRAVMAVIAAASGTCTPPAKTKYKVYSWDVHSVEKTLSCENYKPLTMGLNKFSILGLRILQFSYSKCKTVPSCDRCELP